MSILARKQPADSAPKGTEPAPDIARRAADLAADDLRSYADTGGYLPAWPERFADPRFEDEFIPRLDRPFYYRDVAEEYRVRADLPMTMGPPEVDRALHRRAHARARLLRKQKEREDHEALLDRTNRRCEVCGKEGDRSVAPRSIGRWRTRRATVLVDFGPRICAPCVPIVEEKLRALRVAIAADDETPNGRREDAAGAWVEANKERLI